MYFSRIFFCASLPNQFELSVHDHKIEHIFGKREFGGFPSNKINIRQIFLLHAQASKFQERRHGLNRVDLVHRRRESMCDCAVTGTDIQRYGIVS